MKRGIIVFILALIAIGGYFYVTRPIPSGSDIIPIATYKEPFQESLKITEPIAYAKGKLHLSFQPVASYRITARILHKHRYQGDWSSKIAPYDLALGWGDMADKEYLKGIKISQMQRFYMYNLTPDNYYKMDYIAKHSANCHIIPATKNLRHLLRTLRKNDIVELEGFLVMVSGNYKRGTVSWGTSTTRDDTGNGACELIYVNKIKHAGKIYQ